MAERRSTVLIVNDEPAKTHLLRRILSAEYDVLVALDGETALAEIAKRAELDLILMDVAMPGISGYDVCRQVKSNPATRHIPLIFVTAMGEDEDETFGLSLGAVDYLTDPISPSVLLARVKTQVALARSRRELEARSREMAEKNKSLEWTHQQLKETLESRLQMINTVSHDLRSPLTSILLSVDRIQAHPEGIPAKVSKTLGVMAKEAARLNAIVKGLLDQNRAESLTERLSLTRTCPRELLESLGDTLALKAEDRGLRSHLYLDPDSLEAPLMLDVAAMHQVLFNLVENALKFTDPPGDVGVRSTLQRPNWLLEVWDSGRGIPQADCERLFNSFQQSQEKDAQKGWGLGLFICRSIVMAHGGRIEVDSDLGKGAIFRVFLPLALD
jgi:signal transduction histidine kinase